jgi:hypothetical protein
MGLLEERIIIHRLLFDYHSIAYALHRTKLHSSITLSLHLSRAFSRNASPSTISYSTTTPLHTHSITRSFIHLSPCPISTLHLSRAFSRNAPSTISYSTTTTTNTDQLVGSRDSPGEEMMKERRASLIVYNHGRLPRGRGVLGREGMRT